jgi:serine protease Do
LYSPRLPLIDNARAFPFIAYFTIFMSKRLPLCLLALIAAATVSHGQTRGITKVAASASAEKPPSVIPAPRAEPVVPPSPAKSIATQLNDAFVNVFERVAPAVVVIDVYKRNSGGEVDPADYFQDFFFRSPEDGGEKEEGKEGKRGEGAKENKRGESSNKEGGPEESSKGEGASPNSKGKGGAPVVPPPSRNQRAQSEGSGFIIQSSGYILTNNHVVNGAASINVRLKDGRQFPGRLIGADDKTDIAVVKIEAADLPTAELADSDATRVGEIACAIGVPFNLDYTFTTGIVSAKGRSKLNITPDDYEDYLQTDAAINPGNSGGPLVNLDGKVIGMNTLIHGLNRGLGFAIPSNMLRQVGDQLIHAGKVVRSYIGVRIVSVEEAAEKYGAVFSAIKKGVIVDTILADSPAFKSDLRQADVILEVDGVPVASDRDLQKLILGKKVGATVQLSVLRRGKNLKVPVVTGELPTVATKSFLDPSEDSNEKPKESPRQFYGLQLQDLTRELAASLGVSASNGVLVTSVAEESPAARAGISVRDVITAVDDKPVKDVGAFKEAIKAGDPKRGIPCYLERLTGKTFVVIKTD